MADEPSFNVEVVSAEQTLLSVEAVEVFARSLDGEIGILPGHQPALLALDIAPVRVVRADGGDDEHIAVHNGFLYYQGDQLVILADLAEVASQIDERRAEQRRAELEERGGREAEAEVQASIRKQEVRLRVAGHA